MGKYSVGTHGPHSGRDLQGIATLTHDPVAIDNLRHKQNPQDDYELERLWKDAVVEIEEAKRKIFEATATTEEDFEK